jgi:hypothetical protein
MIREQAIVEWRREAPWTANWMVEQDLVISRALVKTAHPEQSTATYTGEQ